MTSETLAANTTAKAAASTGAAAILRAVQSGASKKITMIAAVVEALSAATLREFCKALGLWYVVDKSAVRVAHTGSTSEFAFATITIPAGALGPNGMVRVWAVFSCTSSGNNKILRARFGGAAGTAFQETTITTSGSSSFMRFFQNRNSQASQVSGAASSASGSGNNSLGVVTATINSANAQDIVISGQLANAGEEIALEGYLVELHYDA